MKYAMERFNTISMKFDKAFIDSVDVSYDAFSESMKDVSTDLADLYRNDSYALLQIRRSHLERLMIGAIRYHLPPAECWAIFLDREELGYDSPVSRWLLCQNVIVYCGTENASIWAQICKILKSIRESLSETSEGCQECLVQLDNYAHGPDSV